MIRPTKRLLIDSWAILLFVVVVGFHRPWTGDPQAFSRLPATPLTLVLFYGIGTVVTVLAIRDILHAVKTGGAFLRGPRRQVTLSLANDRWRWLGPTVMGPNEGLWFCGKCIESTHHLVTFTLGLVKAGEIDEEPTFCCKTKSFELAWEAEAFPRGTLIPERAGSYMLGIRATGTEPGVVRLKLEWARTWLGRGDNERERRSRSSA